MESTVSDVDVKTGVQYDPAHDYYDSNPILGNSSVELATSKSTDEAKCKEATEAYLVFTRVPNKLTIDGLVNICSSYGNVSHSSAQGKRGMYLVYFQSVNDMERVYTALCRNTYGFRVNFGKTKPQLQEQAEKPEESWDDSEPVDNSMKGSSAIDYTEEINTNRTYHIPKEYPQRPKRDANPLVTEEDYTWPTSHLRHVDPQRHFLINHDAHEVERFTNRMESVSLTDGKYNYYTGRAFYVLSTKEQSFIRKKQQITKGVYDPREQIFAYNSPASSRIKLGLCAYCHKECQLVCERCSTYYCTPHCQKSHWQQHRIKCGQSLCVARDVMSSDEKESHQEDGTSNMNSAYHPLIACVPSNKSTVILTAITKTNLVFVRNLDDLQKHLNVDFLVNSEGKRQQPLQEMPKKGDIVLTKFKDGRYNRAMVLNVHDSDNIYFIYIDFGNVDSKPLADLYEASDKLKELPRAAIPIVLSGVPDCFLTTALKTLMYSFLNEQFTIKLDVHTPECQYNSAELFIKTDQSLNSLIVDLLQTTSEESEEIIFRDNLTILPLPVGEKIKLFITDNTSLQVAFVSCTVVPYVLAIQSFNQDIQDYMKSIDITGPYNPRVNEMCLAKYSTDGCWYRGICVESVGDGHPTILFLDYGNMCPVSVKNIVRYTKRLDFPLMTADCEILDLPDLVSSDVKDKLSELLQPGTEIVCDKVHKVDQDNYKISIATLLGDVLQGESSSTN